MKRMNYLKKVLIALVAATSASALQGAGVISVNIGADIDATRVLTDYGVPGLETVVGNWNNIGFTFANPLWEDGSESTVLIETGFPWGKDDDGGAPRRYGAGTVGTPLHHGPNVYPATPEVSLTFSNLRANFPDGYYVVVYLTGFASDEAGSRFNQGIVSDGRTTFYYRTPGDLTTPITMDDLVETTVTSDPGSGNYPMAHYAVYGSKDLPKNADVYKISISSSNRAVSIGGAQIVSATFEGGSGTTMWAGYAVDGEGWVDTSPWLGWINVSQGDYVWSINLGKYIYLPEGFVSESGAWSYVPGN
ncbi:MAG: hypothetical protein AB3N33_02950 [Puniceicoccaceae bacterium]